jgi:hypothetical protein
MHHFWRIASVSYAASATDHEFVFENTKKTQITLKIPKKGFWVGNDDVEKTQADMLANSILWLLNSTCQH